MRVFYLGGWILVFLACFAAIAETVAHAVPHAGGFILSAYDVWYALWPGSLVVTKIRLETGLGPWAWDPLMTTLLMAPGWVLFGVPGAALVWLGWPRGRSEEDGGDDEEREESLFLYDELVAHVADEEREFAAFERELAARTDPPPENDEKEA